jgi:hypothetical protein
MPPDPTARIREIALALPEAAERLTWGEVNFRVRDKIFVMLGSDQPPSCVLKAPQGAQAILVGADPARFFVPSYVGHKGWVGIRLDGEPDWTEIAFLIRRSYRMTAPKRLATLVAS